MQQWSFYPFHPDHSPLQHGNSHRSLNQSQTFKVTPIQVQLNLFSSIWDSTFSTGVYLKRGGGGRDGTRPGPLIKGTPNWNLPRVWHTIIVGIWNPTISNPETFEVRTFWRLDYTTQPNPNGQNFWAFEYRTSPVFRWLLYLTFSTINTLFQSSFYTTIQIPNHLTTGHKSIIWIPE